jgi:hypothetical protein
MYDNIMNLASLRSMEVLLEGAQDDLEVWMGLKHDGNLDHPLIVDGMQTICCSIWTILEKLSPEAATMDEPSSEEETENVLNNFMD